MKNNYVILLLLFLGISAYSQVSRNAGLIVPYTQDAILTVSSGINKEFIRDGYAESFWESNNPLPNNFISSNEQNFFLKEENFEIVGDHNNYLLAFDGNTDSKSDIKKGKTEIKLFTHKSIKFISLKFNVTDSLLIKLHFNDGTIKKLKYTQKSNYKLQKIEIKNNKILKSITLESNSDYQLFEIAAVDSELVEWVNFEFEKAVEIGYFSSKHLNGDGVISIEVFYSNNSRDWKKICNLNPTAVATIPILVQPEIFAKYLRIRFVLKPIAFNKAVLRDFAVYDKYGPFGKPSKSIPANKSWNESMGVNAIWGWGYGVPSSQLKNESGSKKFSRIGNLARSYHRLDWDISNAGDLPDFIRREQNADSLLSKWLNWKEEYGIWNENSMTIDACILFNNEYFHENKWLQAYSQAKTYGKQFGNFFVNQNQLVKTVEIGNEPWGYSKTKYRDILRGMSDGFKEVTPELIVLPCGLQAFDNRPENNNYLPDYLDTDVNVDGLNTHIYSYIMDDQGQRVAINPEDVRSETWSVNNLKAWAKANNFTDDIYVTEFGFDSDGGGDDCIHSNCISDFQQAIYGVRQAMIFYRLGVKQFYWYYYANVDWISILHNRSGLVSSYKAGFQEKLSFKSFDYVNKSIGNLYFANIVSENKDVYCYSFADANGTIKAYITWRPTSENHKETKWVELPISENIKSINLVDLSTKEVSYKREIKKLKIALSGVPAIVFLR